MTGGGLDGSGTRAAITVGRANIVWIEVRARGAQAELIVGVGVLEVAVAEVASSSVHPCMTGRWSRILGASLVRRARVSLPRTM